MRKKKELTKPNYLSKKQKILNNDMKIFEQRLINRLYNKPMFERSVREHSKETQNNQFSLYNPILTMDNMYRNKSPSDIELKRYIIYLKLRCTTSYGSNNKFLLNKNAMNSASEALLPNLTEPNETCQKTVHFGTNEVKPKPYKFDMLKNSSSNIKIGHIENRSDLTNLYKNLDQNLETIDIDIGLKNTTQQNDIVKNTDTNDIVKQEQKQVHEQDKPTNSMPINRLKTAPTTMPHHRVKIKDIEKIMNFEEQKLIKKQNLDLQMPNRTQFFFQYMKGIKK
jgi:hypothetical protein